VVSYSLEIEKSAAKELGNLPGKECTRVVARIQVLGIEPRPHGSEKLSADDKHRMRQGVDRILYEIDDEARKVTIVKIAHRKEVYR
jgi:mRNA interferase RelE/StbE